MVVASTFAGTLSLVCHMLPVEVVASEPVTIEVRNGAAQIAGLDDVSIEHGLIANRAPNGGLRLVAMTVREPEMDVWADLTPDRRGGYALAFHSAPHGISTPSNVWGEGRCTVETENRGISR
jgi:hypothetical protein